ncbi:hypothetical protein ACVBGC_10120 [Burkholderia stagnalis]
MTLAIRIDWQSGAVHADRIRIEVDSNGPLGEEIQSLGLPMQILANGAVRYRMSGKVAFLVERDKGRFRILIQRRQHEDVMKHLGDANCVRNGGR